MSSFQPRLLELMNGLRSYLPEQDTGPISVALANLKEDLDYDGAMINQIQLALYLFQVHALKCFYTYGDGGCVPS